MTRFGEILPLGHKLKCLWHFYLCLFSIWQKLLPTLVNFCTIGQFLKVVVIGQIMKTIKAIWLHCSGRGAMANRVGGVGRCRSSP